MLGYQIGDIVSDRDSSMIGYCPPFALSRSVRREFLFHLVVASNARDRTSKMNSN